MHELSSHEKMQIKDNMPECQVFEYDGCPIHYWLIGDASQPLVTFIHGAATDHHIFDPQIATTAQFFRVLLWDMRGHGMSQPSRTPFSVRSAVEDLIALLDHLGYDKSGLVGVSLGGNIAQEVVLLFPERVGALVIAGTPCNTLAIVLVTRFFLWVFKLVIRYAPIEILRRLLTFFAALKPEARSYVYWVFFQVSGQSLRQIMGEFSKFFQRPPVSSTYRIIHPLLLLHGQYDWNQCLMPRWSRREPNCRYIVIPRAGHLANWDNASYFNDILVAFLKEQSILQFPEMYEMKKGGIHGGPAEASL